jgi:hypothetical protein
MKMANQSRKKKQIAKDKRILNRKFKSKGKKEDVMTEISQELAEKVAGAQKMKEPIDKDYYTKEEEEILTKIHREKEAARRQRAKERVMAAIESGALEDQNGDYMFACQRGNGGPNEVVICPPVGDYWVEVLEIMAATVARAIRGLCYDPEKDSFDQKFGEEMLELFWETVASYVPTGGNLVRDVGIVNPV